MHVIFVIPIAGGVASFAGEGSPFNKVAGLGFGGVPGSAALDEIEKAFAACGSPAQIELAQLADPAIGALLTGRGYRLESFENVLGRARTGEPERVMPPGVDVRPSGAEEFETWLEVVAEGSANPDTQGVPWHEEFPREVIIGAERDMTAAGAVRYAALRDGTIAGGATMRRAEGVAQLTGAATAPAHRRRGVHTALLSARLQCMPSCALGLGDNYPLADGRAASRTRATTTSRQRVSGPEIPIVHVIIS